MLTSRPDFIISPICESSRRCPERSLAFVKLCRLQYCIHRSIGWWGELPRPHPRDYQESADHHLTFQGFTWHQICHSCLSMIKHDSHPYAPIPSANGLGVGVGYLSTPSPHRGPFGALGTEIFRPMFTTTISGSMTLSWRGDLSQDAAPTCSSTPKGNKALLPGTFHSPW